MRRLLQLRILPQPLRIDGESRILILSTQGLIMDLQLPSADRQKKLAGEERSTKPPARKND